MRAMRAVFGAIGVAGSLAAVAGRADAKPNVPPGWYAGSGLGGISQAGWFDLSPMAPDAVSNLVGPFPIGATVESFTEIGRRTADGWRFSGRYADHAARRWGTVFLSQSWKGAPGTGATEVRYVDDLRSERLQLALARRIWSRGATNVWFGGSAGWDGVWLSCSRTVQSLGGLSSENAGGSMRLDGVVAELQMEVETVAFRWLSISLTAAAGGSSVAGSGGWSTVHASSTEVRVDRAEVSATLNRVWAGFGFAVHFSRFGDVNATAAPSAPATPDKP